MRYSQLLIPTVKEAPADAETASHQLLIRAGFMRKLASGTYIYLPLGWRSLLKIITIIREEMNRSGAQEILMPALQPMELWQQTGRDVDYGETMCRLTDRHKRQNVLAPTAEEVVTYLASCEIKSYKQLPMNLYQISPKFRDEFRPRFGPIRSREFIMKDAYSFHDSPESLDKTYWLMYDTYCRIFKRCGLQYVAVEAETGEMGGSGSHQFTIPCESGEDTIVYTEDGSYAANLERAAVDPIPRESVVSGRGSAQEVHTPNVGSIEAVCAFLQTKPQDMIKTLIFSGKSGVIAVLVRGDHEINPEKLHQIPLAKGAVLAEEKAIEQVTGAKVGFAGPVGLKLKIPLIIDHAVAAMAVGIAGANKTDYHIKNVVPGRDFPLEGENIIVADVRNATPGDTYNGKKLLFKKGIEVGQVFKLGTKYSEKLGATYLDQTSNEKPCLMGCYGIGVNRILASAVELYNDKDGIIWPISIAPFEVVITCVNQEDTEVAQVAEKIYEQLLDQGVEVLLDDRIMRAGAKFKDADLIGVPIRITVGKKSIAEGNVEIKLRTESQNRQSAIDKAAETVLALIKQLKDKLNN
jgi:prolyl-tRNA synthetase